MNENSNPATTYENDIKRLQQIVQQMENGQLNIDDLAAQLKEAKTLITRCQKKLTDVEQDVAKILNDDASLCNVKEN